jgi:hypothetical protein
MLQFRELISDLGLIDIPLRGRRFTWSNARTDPSVAKLDRFLISAEWSSQFPNTSQATLPNSSSAIAFYYVQSKPHLQSPISSGLRTSI